MSDVAQSNLAVVQGLYEAYAGGDVEGFIGRLAKDVTWIEPDGSPFGGVYRGPQAVRDGVIVPAIGEWETFEVVPERFVDAGDTIVVLVTERGIATASGTAVEARAAQVFDVTDGRVVRFENFEDTAVLQQAVASGG